MDERRLSRLMSDDRHSTRPSRRATLGDGLLSSYHLTAPPQPHWYGIGVLGEFGSPTVSPTENPIAWAILNSFPNRAVLFKQPNRGIGMIAQNFSTFYRLCCQPVTIREYGYIFGYFDNDVNQNMQRALNVYQPAVAFLRLHDIQILVQQTLPNMPAKDVTYVYTLTLGVQ
ncbi:unnamed protein product [Angiostrongylus costaricensis]|uniref:RRM_2 domain-containing protein n=1 Tax=Angiostrongylus costaricensis TaxID=334426 RepID=A0A158PM26_ANGCS|nr:unnamed protein product [Angiostrongylus costaricensis]